MASEVSANSSNVSRLYNFGNNYLGSQYFYTSAPATHHLSGPHDLSRSHLDGPENIEIASDPLFLDPPLLDLA